MAKKSWLSKYLKQSKNYKVNPRVSSQKKSYLKSIRSGKSDRGRGSGARTYQSEPYKKALQKVSGYDPNSRVERIYEEIGKFSKGEIQKAQRALGIKEVRGRRAGRLILKELVKPSKAEPIEKKKKKAVKEKVEKKPKLSAEQLQIKSLTKDYDKLYGKFEDLLGGEKKRNNSLEKFFKRQNKKRLRDKKARDKKLNQYIKAQAAQAADDAAQAEADEKQAEMERNIFMENQMRAATSAAEIRFGSQNPREAMTGTSQFRRRGFGRELMFGGINI